MTYLDVHRRASNLLDILQSLDLDHVFQTLGEIDLATLGELDRLTESWPVQDPLRLVIMGESVDRWQRSYEQH